MKKILSILTMGLLISTLSFAQSEAPTGDVAPGPKMNLETSEIDYGTIEQNSEPYRFFKFTNSGDEPLQITNAKGSCGCTVPEWPKEPIFPGESSEVKVRYDTKRIGKFVKRVTLTTNDAKGSYVLTIKGDVLKPAAEPAGLPEAAPSIILGNQ